MCSPFSTNGSTPISSVTIPEHYELAQPELVPQVTLRAPFETNIPHGFPKFAAVPPGPHRPLAEHLQEQVVYRQQQQRIPITNDVLAKWKVSADELFAAAEHNLRQTHHPVCQQDGLYVIGAGDPDGPAQLLQTELFLQLGVGGDPVACLLDQRLVVCGTQEDDALKRLAAQLERFDLTTSCGIAFCLTAGMWAPWLPPEDHPTYPSFHAARQVTMFTAYFAQQELLEEQPTESLIAEFVSTDMRPRFQKSFTIWTEGHQNSLPEAEFVCFRRSDGSGGTQVIGAASWRDVQHLLGDRMELQVLYPKRWLVREFPEDALLRALAVL